uniref:Uncharacterized protein n=1 Tax=Candidatus Kentrum sp. LPFa TaxID=2126335 RepID=A0A450X5Z3_9GAMM|nr:MAG: hypothetical protein BECKLPF1236B_GA0070989_14253 [Candidatus Kentron sp. LPFa]
MTRQTFDFDIVLADLSKRRLRFALRANPNKSMLPHVHVGIRSSSQPTRYAASIPAITSKPIIEDHYSVTEKIFDKTIKKFLTCHFERSEKSSASKILRMHKISPSGRDDIFFIYVMKF